MDGRNTLSYWYNRLASWVKTPATHILGGVDQHSLYEMFEGRESKGLETVAFWVLGKGDLVGWPCFIRTGLSSGKHFWSKTCYCPVADIDVVQRHIYEIAEYSALAGVLGLLLDEWVVREFLEADAVFIGPYDMPVCSEWRFFISGGEIVDYVFYWPEDAFERSCWKNRPEGWKLKLKELSRQKPPAEIIEDTKRVAKEFKKEGGWSVDWMKTKKGWYAIDMAVAQESWGCPESLKAV